MSLSKISLVHVVKKQFLYKLSAYTGVFNSLLLIQGIAILLSFGSTASMGSSSYGIDMDIDYKSADTVVVLTMLWAFINAITIITKKYREDDFAFVTNRLSNNLSNILFLFVASIIGGVTAILSAFLVRVISFFILQNQSIIGHDVLYSTQEILSGIVVTILYLFLFCSLGYFAGWLTQLHKSLVVVVPVAFVGLYIAIGWSGSNVLLHSIEFYAKETNVLLFVSKTVITSLLFFMVAVMISNRLEVRR